MYRTGSFLRTLKGDMPGGKRQKSAERVGIFLTGSAPVTAVRETGLEVRNGKPFLKGNMPGGQRQRAVERGGIFLTGSAPASAQKIPATKWSGFWCARRDLNPYVFDTRTSNVPVCQFQHSRIFTWNIRYYSTEAGESQAFFQKKMAKVPEFAWLFHLTVIKEMCYTDSRKYKRLS